MIASVMPSAKYSCSGSRDRLSSGSTASDRIRRRVLVDRFFAAAGAGASAHDTRATSSAERTSLARS